MSTAVSVVQGPPSSGSAASSTPATESKVTTEKQTGAGVDGAVCVPPPPATLQTHYEELLRLVAEVGKDVKPAYTNSKISADRLKRNIALARTTLRDCLLDIERLNQIHSQK